MKIFVSSSYGLIWNANAPILNEYKDDVILIIMSEEEKKYVNYDYKTIVNPYNIVLYDRTGLQSKKYGKLLSISDEIENNIDIDEDVIVLADNAPTTLYIFNVLQNINKRKSFNLHLWAMLPFSFEGKRRRSIYQGLLYDTSNIKSMLLFDSDKFIEELNNPQITLKEIIEKVKETSYKMLPQIINFFKNMDKDKKYFFDMQINRYVDMTLMDEFWHDDNKKDDEFMELLIENFKKDLNDKEYILSCEPKVNGKEICKKLREIRKKFADTNGIEFNSEECSYNGPCAGTCEKCDEELKYLQKQIEKLDNKDIVYPYYKIGTREKRTNKENKKSDNVEEIEVRTMGLLRRKKPNDKK